MFKNYFILNRLVIESKSLLRGSIIKEIFSQEKDKLIFNLIKNKENIFLEISVNPGFPYIKLLDEFHRAKKNSIDFFTDYLPAAVEEFDIAGADRILRLSLSTSKIYILIRGKFTDVVLLDNYNNARFFKKYPDDNIGTLIKELNSTGFIDKENIPDIYIKEKDEFFESVKRKYPFIGKEILLELKTRNNAESNYNRSLSIKNIIKEVFTENPVVYFDDNYFRLNLFVKGFANPEKLSVKEFDSINSALDFYISKKYYYDSASSLKRNILKHIDRETGKLSNKINDIKSLLDRGSREEYYSKLGNLLLININKIRNGLKFIDVENIYENNIPVQIKLDEKLSPQKNADRYFDKAKSDKILLERSYIIFKDLGDKIKYLNESKIKVEKEVSIEALNKYAKELKMKDPENITGKEDLRIKFKHYIIENKYHVYVGRDSTNNDLLTVKFAKQNDYWFHARSVPGSHVVLRVENSKETVPKNILKNAASIAAFHSKAKTSGMVPVSFTFKKYVIKKKGMEAGKVALLKEDVLIVKPEVPVNCEFVPAD